jgi:hypothetical protein
MLEACMLVVLCIVMYRILLFNVHFPPLQNFPYPTPFLTLPVLLLLTLPLRATYFYPTPSPNPTHLPSPLSFSPFPILPSLFPITIPFPSPLLYTNCFYSNISRNAHEDGNFQGQKIQSQIFDIFAEFHKKIKNSLSFQPFSVD